MPRIKQRPYKRGTSAFFRREIEDKGLTRNKSADIIVIKSGDRKYSKMIFLQKTLKDVFTLEEDDKFESLINNIYSIKPSSPYEIYFKEELKQLPKNKKLNCYCDKQNIISNKWKELNDKEKNKYKEKYDLIKLNYEKNKKLIRKYIFMRVNRGLISVPTAYKYYEYEQLIKNYKGNIDIKLFKQQVKLKWDTLKLSEKLRYSQIRYKCNNYILKTRTLSNINNFSVFVQKMFDDYNKDIYYDDDIPQITLREIKSKWKSLPKIEKIKYVNIAKELINEKDSLINLYRVINDIRFKRPAGAFRIFTQDLIKENKDNIDNITISYAKNLFNKLPVYKKDFYLSKYQKVILAYKYKELLKSNKIRKFKPVKKPGSILNEYIKSKKDIKIPVDVDYYEYWYQQYEKITLDEYIKLKDEIDKKEKAYNDYKETMKYKKFEMPKKPLNSFNTFFKENRYKIEKDKTIDKNLTLSKKVLTKWNSLDEEDKKIYEEKAANDLIRFRRETLEFNTFGYYTDTYSIFKSGINNVLIPENNKEDFDSSDEDDVPKKRKVKDKKSPKRNIKFKKIIKKYINKEI